VRSSCRGGAVPECLADFSDTIWINTTSAKGNFPSELSTLLAAQCIRVSCGWVRVCHQGLPQQCASTTSGANDVEIRGSLETRQPP
jgi:hypothetical protein